MRHNVISTVLREYQHTSHRYAQSNNVLLKKGYCFQVSMSCLVEISSTDREI